MIAIRDAPFVTLAAICGFLTLCWGLMSAGLPLWIAGHTQAPHALPGAIILFSSVAIASLQVRFSRTVNPPPDAAKGTLRSAASLAICCVLVALAAGRGVLPASALLLACPGTPARRALVCRWLLGTIEWVMSSLAPEKIAGLGFEVVVRNAPVAIGVIAASGRVIYCNARLRDLISRQLGDDMPADLAGGIDIFHPDGRRYEQREWPAVRSITSGEEIAEEEFFYELPAGARLWIRCSSSPVQDEEGEIVAAVLSMTDVTERKRQEERSIEMAGLLEHVQDAVLVMDDRFVLTGWNNAAVAMFGWSAEEAIGRAVYELLPPEYSDEQQAAELQKLTRTGQWRGERVWRAKDGAPVAAEGLTVAVRRGDGDDISGYICIMRDIAERKRAEQALRESHRRIETILESISDGFYTLDRDWRLTYVNEQALQFASGLAGRELTRDEMLGETLWTLYPGTVGTWLEDTYRRAMREQEPVAFEYQYPGSEPWLEVHAYPSEEGLSIYFHEITERKEAEQRLVAAREAERCRIARALHDEALQGLSDAIALAALADRTTAESWLAGRLLPVLRRAGEQLRAAVYDLRLQSEEQTPFVELLERLVDEHRAMLGDGEIELEVGDGTPTGSLGVTGAEVLRILGETLTNARRHGNARRVRVGVRVSNDELSIEVLDNGRGFDTASPVSPIHRGITGMRERAALLNGRVDIHSEPGVGTRVRFEAPLTNETSRDV